MSVHAVHSSAIKETFGSPKIPFLMVRIPGCHKFSEKIYLSKMSRQWRAVMIMMKQAGFK
jgi:hypothetical protein